jgi:hypothetical protein
MSNTIVAVIDEGSYSFSVIRSTDEGVTWGSPIALNFDPAEGVDDASPPYIASDGVNVMIAYGASVALVGPGYDYFMVSPNAGGLWLSSTHTERLYSAAYGAGTFVAFPETGKTVYTSPTGTTWTAQLLAMPSTNKWRDVCFGAGVFVARWVPVSRISYSSNGISWSALVIPPTDITSGKVCFAGSLFFGYAGIYHGGNPGAYSTSPDGVNWTARAFYTGASPYGRTNIVYANGTYLAVGAYGTDYFYTSTTGIDSWARHDVSAHLGTGATLLSAASTGTTFIVTGENTTESFILTSSDGATWTKTTMVAPAKVYYLATAVPVISPATLYASGAVFHIPQSGEVGTILTPLDGSENASQIHTSPANQLEIWQSPSATTEINSYHAHGNWPYPALITGPLIPDEYVNVAHPGFSATAVAGAAGAAELPKFGAAGTIAKTASAAVSHPGFTAYARLGVVAEAALPKFTAAATAEQESEATATATLPRFTAYGYAGAKAQAEHPGFSAASEGSVTRYADADIDIPKFMAAGTGSQRSAMDGNADLPRFLASGTTNQVFPITAGADLPSFRATAAANNRRYVDANVDLPGFTAAGTANPLSLGSGVVELPGFYASGFIQGRAGATCPLQHTR